MKKILYLFFIYPLCSLSISGQTILMQEVVGSDGGQYVLSSSIIDWTVGEWMIESHTTEPYLEAGFLHAYIPKEMTTANRNLSVNPQKISIWPNPAPSHFYLDAGEGQYDKVKLVEVSGRVLQEWKHGPGYKYQLNAISAGTYFVILSKEEITRKMGPVSIINH